MIMSNIACQRSECASLTSIFVIKEVTPFTNRLSIVRRSTVHANMLTLLGTIVVISAVLGSSQAALSDDYQKSERLDTKNETEPTFEMYWTYNKTDSTISFAAKAKAANDAWVGLGFTTKIDDTTTYDVVRGSLDTFNPNDTAKVYDLHAVGKQTPQKDTKQDLMDTSVTKQGSYTVLKFKRSLDTKDSNDTVIRPGPMIVVWSYGNTPQLLSGYNEIGYKNVTLIPVESHTDTTPTTGTSTTTAPVSKADVCQVKWALFALSTVLFMVFSGLSPA